MATDSVRSNGREAKNASETMTEAVGASTIGPFDYCPPLGFREYWYPGIEAKKVGKKPVPLLMMGEELVLFRDEENKVVALEEWCPHRGTRLSLGVCEFKGTITCPYHGYVFDSSGQCVAGLIDKPDSTLASKLRARKFPTEERSGIVFVWMGETDPVPLDEDLPWEFKDPTLTGRNYMRVNIWEANWTEATWQAIDFHEMFLHRGVNFYRVINKGLGFFRPKGAYTGGVKIIEEGETHVSAVSMDPHAGQAYYPSLKAKWPRHVWWRRLPRRKFGGNKPLVNWAHNLELGGKSRTNLGGSIYLRWAVALNDDQTRMWVFTVARRPKTWLGRLYQAMWYYFYLKPSIVIRTNEREDLPIFKKGNINLSKPQKLGQTDVGVIYYRRHLARRSRDFQRLGGAHGALKQPATRTASQWRQMELQERNGSVEPAVGGRVPVTADKN